MRSCCFFRETLSRQNAKKLTISTDANALIRWLNSNICLEFILSFRSLFIYHILIKFNSFDSIGNHITVKMLPKNFYWRRWDWNSPRLFFFFTLWLSLLRPSLFCVFQISPSSFCFVFAFLSHFHVNHLISFLTSSKCGKFLKCVFPKVKLTIGFRLLFNVDEWERRNSHFDSQKMYESVHGIPLYESTQCWHIGAHEIDAEKKK